MWRALGSDAWSDDGDDMRLAALGLYYQANTFCPIAADAGAFGNGGIVHGGEITEQFAGSSTALGGFLAAGDALGVEVVPLIYAEAICSGPVTKQALEWLVGNMREQLVSRGPWEGVLLALHGAAVAQHVLDADGELAMRVRCAVGRRVPIGAVLDMHANISPRLAKAVNVLVVTPARTHPDTWERAVQCARLVVRTARGEIAPQMAAVPARVLNAGCPDPGQEPMAGLVAAAAEIGDRPGMLSASVAAGFPYADVPHMGMSCLVIHDGDHCAATSAAHELSCAVWTQRRGLQRCGFFVEEALDRAERDPTSPVLLLDAGDDIASGAPGDSTVILSAAVRRGVRSMLLPLCDPEAVRLCSNAEAGAWVRLRVGARHAHSAGPPVAVEGRVRVVIDGAVDRPGSAQGMARLDDAGTIAVVDTSDDNTLVLTSRRTRDPGGELCSCGVNPGAYRIVVAKRATVRTALAPVAARVITVDTDGITPLGLHRLPYVGRPRPLYPFEAGVMTHR